MARLLTSGGEVGVENGDFGHGTDGNGAGISGGVVPVIQSSVFRSGASALKFDSGAGTTGESFCEWKDNSATQWSFATNRWYYLRVYLYFPDVTPATEYSLLAASLSGSTVVAVRHLTDGTLQLSRRVNGPANIGTPSAALQPDTWYRVEFGWYVATSGANSECALYIDGSNVSSVSAQNFNNTALNRFEIGQTTTTGQASFISYADDIAWNDDTGAAQNTWPGEGEVVLLRPISDSQQGTWTGGSGGTTNLYDAVNNTPPIGSASESNTTQIESTETSGDNATDEYRANLTTYTDAGIGASDTITLMHPILWHGDDAGTGTLTGSYGGVSNPSWTYDTFTFADAQGALGTWTTNWAGEHGTPQYSPSVTLGTSPVLAVRKTDANAGTGSVCFMGVHVEYVAAEGPAETPSLRLVRSNQRW